MLTRSKSGSSQSAKQISSASQQKQFPSDTDQLEVCHEISCSSQAEDSQPNLGVLTRSKSSSAQSSESLGKGETNKQGAKSTQVRPSQTTNRFDSQQKTRQQLKQKSHRPCYFKDEWLEDKELIKKDVQDPTDPVKAFCRYCMCTFSVKSNGIRQIKQHVISEKHKKMVALNPKRDGLPFDQKQMQLIELRALAELTLVYHNI